VNLAGRFIVLHLERPAGWVHGAQLSASGEFHPFRRIASSRVTRCAAGSLKEPEGIAARSRHRLRDLLRLDLQLRLRLRLRLRLDLQLRLRLRLDLQLRLRLRLDLRLRLLRLLRLQLLRLRLGAKGFELRPQVPDLSTVLLELDIVLGFKPSHEAGVAPNRVRFAVRPLMLASVRKG